MGSDLRVLFILSVSLVRSEPGKTITSLMQGYRWASTEDEAKGSFISAVLREKPDFSISQLLCMLVPDVAIRQLGDTP